MTDTPRYRGKKIFIGPSLDDLDDGPYFADREEFDNPDSLIWRLIRADAERKALCAEIEKASLALRMNPPKGDR